MTIRNNKFAISPLAAAVAFAVAAGSALAATTPNQQPGGGLVRAVTPGTTVDAINFTQVGGGVGTFITNGAFNAQLVLNGPANSRAVVQWGGPGSPLEIVGPNKNPVGFNIGQSATLFFTAAAAGGAILNIDASNKVSEINGNLISIAAPFAPAVFVSNANGITLGQFGRIVAPTGVGLIGADLNNPTAINDFVGNVTGVAGTGPSYVDVTGAQSGAITIAGAINGDLFANIPAQYIFLAGGDVMNLPTGNLFGQIIAINAGTRAIVDATQTVNGVPNTPVQRLWGVDTLGPGGGYYALGTFNFTLATATNGGALEIGSGASSFTNTGSISQQPGPFGGILVALAANSIRSGTAGDLTPTLGIFSDDGFIFNTYDGNGAGTSKVELYNTVTSYTTANSLAGLQINPIFGSSAGTGGAVQGNNQYNTAGDVIINTLTGAGAPSSITTTGGVFIGGTNIAINSTINHKNKVDGGVQAIGTTTEIVGSKSVTIDAAVGSGGNLVVTVQRTATTGGLTINKDLTVDTGKTNNNFDMFLQDNAQGSPVIIAGNLLNQSTNAGADIFVTAWGPLTTTGTMTTGRVVGTTLTGGSIFVANNASGGGTVTKISGALTAGSSVSVRSDNPPPGIFDSVLDISAPIVATNGTATAISGGDLILGKVTATTGVALGANGFSALLNDAVTTSGGNINMNNFVSNKTEFKPAAVLSAKAGSVNLNGGSFVGVNASGAAYASAAEKPAAQIVTNNFTVVARGSVNAPIAGNTFWPDNALWIAPSSAAGTTNAQFSAVGGAFQAINLGFTNNVLVGSGNTLTPFNLLGVSSGTGPVGALQGNEGSSLIVHAKGNLTTQNNLGGAGTGNVGLFQFPGGVVLMADNVLTVANPVMNAWTTAAIPYQGVFFEAKTINALSYVATNGNSWVNDNVMPTSGGQTVYQLTQLSPISYGFNVNPQGVYQNTYTKVITGVAVNGCPVVVCGWH